MKKELSIKQLLVFGFGAILLAKLPLGQLVSVALELGGFIALVAGIVKGIGSLFKKKKKQVSDNQDSAADI